MLQDVLGQQTEMKMEQSDLCQNMRQLESEVLDLRSNPSSSPPCKASQSDQRSHCMCWEICGVLFFTASFLPQNKVSAFHESLPEGFRVDER